MIGGIPSQEREVAGQPVRLAPLAVDDLKTLSIWQSDGQASRFLGQNISRTHAELVRWFDHAKNDPSCLRWTVIWGKERVGSIGISAVDRIAGNGVVDIVIGPAWQGRGIGTASLEILREHAFKDLGFACLYADALAPNLASIRTLEKAGFRQYGTKPHAAICDGRPVDAWLGYATPSMAAPRHPRTLRLADKLVATLHNLIM